MSRVINQVLESKALNFATGAHRGQTRKYSGEPYICHPQEVGRIVAIDSYDPTSEMVAAAYLHDVVEDTKVTLLEAWGRRFRSCLLDQLRIEEINE